ncbi:periodic tryptophan protein 2 homolog [Ischnura elegans]|uniref:periodic tryptophan protein 2 homolog n=1 Tax=Ischnura elegans TaxID=197161 RepID=UPI001ED88EE1|nr:periodic tryptophan protein 2 homolog [Ischnura elegans]
MKFSFKFSNLLGTAYRKGDLLFSPDGNTVISPVGNRISFFDLKNNKSFTLPVESRYNYTTLCISPNGCTLIAINEEGEADLISLISKSVLHKHRFNGAVACACFSPDGNYFAVGKGNSAFVFRAPGPLLDSFNPFVMERVFHGAFDEVTWIDWSSNSLLIAVGSKDMSTRLYGVKMLSKFQYCSMASHTDIIMGCFFEKNSLDLNTVSRNGQVCVWEANFEMSDLQPIEVPVKKARKGDKSDSEDDVVIREDHEGKESSVAKSAEVTSDTSGEKLTYKRLGRYYIHPQVKGEKNPLLTSCAYHQQLRILVSGFSNGSFFIHELPDVTLIHSLSISDDEISSLRLNCTGDWIAIACKERGQLLVWEWQSETYVMKQQGHFNNMECLCYSPDGQFIATGGDDAKVKLWNTTTGFCFVTFSEHTGSVTGIQFSRNGKFVISASTDGTVRAFDLTRYRNFRTFTSPRPVQFSCVAMDSSSEFVAAGGQDVFEIYLWSLKVGRLLEVMSGHEGPVASVAFSPSPASTALASVSWDRTLKLWNAIETGSQHETISLNSDGLRVVYRPDGEEVAVATLDAVISFFNVRTSQQTGSIEGRKDLGSGVSDTDLISARRNLEGKAFNSLCYSADGQCILAGGLSKNVCIYSVQESLLLKKFEITQNRSFDAVDDFINRRNMTEFGNLALVEEREDDTNGPLSIRLPGVRSGDMASRSFKPEVRVFSLQFAPTGQAWAAATTEGLLVYSLDQGLVFDPYFLDIGITPETVKNTLKTKEYCKALMMAVKLNEQKIILEVIEGVPPAEIELTVKSLPAMYVERVLKFIAMSMESSAHLEFYLEWVRHMLLVHGAKLKTGSPLLSPILIAIQKSISRKTEHLQKLCDFNKYTLKYVQRLGELSGCGMKIKEEDVNMESDSNEEDDVLIPCAYAIEMDQ